MQMDVDYSDLNKVISFEDSNFNRWLGSELGIDFDAKANKGMFEFINLSILLFI
jgi:hypothetical protein